MPQNTISNNSRIVYVDPSDTYALRENPSDPNSTIIAEQTPPYENFCIAFNLTVQNFSRFKGNKGTKGDIVLSWTTYPETEYKASFLSGGDFGKTNYDANGVARDGGAPTYLTTYYTDISFDNYGTPKIVEGLGVTQIQVAWESWYTPTVTIQFVDVRGSALFGNEEAIHENGKITADNIFGSFFTLPYPMFKLQMKGFLGEAVTYQLACSGFSGEYNSTTGNFECTATFIGYTYSLLTDVPMQYLMMAPNCDYVGREYWNANKNTADWLLDDGTPPPTLLSLYEKIKSGKIASESYEVSDDDSASLTNNANKRSSLNKVKSYLEEFLNGLKTQAESFVDQTVKMDDGGIRRQILLFYNSDTIKPTQETENNFNKLVSTLNEYNTCYSDAKITTEKLPNKWKKSPSSLSAVKLFNIYKGTNANNYQITVLGNNGKETSIGNLANIQLNEKRQLLYPIAQQLYDIITRTQSDKSSIREYCYVVDVYDFVVLINQELDKIRNNDETINNKIAQKLAEDVKQVVGIKPYIGNVFKIIMCHLETFIHIMHAAGEEIESQATKGMRNPSYLGITMDCTDIPVGRCDYITAWPQVVNRGAVGNNGDYDSTKNTIGWVGDFSHNFCEEKVVKAIQGAIRRVVESISTTEVHQPTNSVALSMTDYLSGTNPFADIVDDLTPSGLAGYLGIRAFQILGVLCNAEKRSKYATLFGKIDAYNLYDAIGSVDKIDSDILKQLGNGSNPTTLVGTALCDRTYDDLGVGEQGSNNRHQEFEDAQKTYYSTSRHPMISESGSNYVFAHYYANEGGSASFAPLTLVPSELIAWSKYRDTFVFNSTTNTPYYDVNPSDSDNPWLHVCNSATLVGANNTSYANTNMFAILKDSTQVDRIMEIYSQLSGGSIAVGDRTLSEDFGDYIKRFLQIDNTTFGRWIGNTILSKKREDLGVDDTKLLPLDGGTSTSVSFTDNTKWLNNSENGIRYNDGQYLNDSNDVVSLEDVTIQQFEVYHNSSEKGCLFGCPFYYMQNNIKDNDTRRYVKALLFLHTFKYDYGTILHVLRPDKTSGGLEGVPYGYLLLIGGLLWRLSQNDDPIQWTEGSYKYKSAGKGHTLFRKVDTEYRFSTFKADDKSASYNVPIQTLFGGGTNWQPDINVTNQLITLFTTFADEQFPTLAGKFGINSRTSKSKFTFTTLTKTITEFTSAIKENKGLSYLNGDSGIKGWGGVYRMMVPSTAKNPNILNMLLEEGTEVLEIAKDIYTRKVIVLDGNYRRLSNTSGDTVKEAMMSKDVYSQYISSFVNTLTEIVQKGKGNQTTESDSPVGSGKTEADRDICISIYLYCKNLWDKWLIPDSGSEEGKTKYDIRKFFNNRFVFIDSFYCSTYSKLPINCDTILYGLSNADLAQSLSISLFTYIDHILSAHNCLFFSLPDFVGLANEDSLASERNRMQNMFTAKTFNEMSPMDEENRFIVLYSGKPSSSINNGGDYVDDGFDIWSRSKGTLAAPSIFSIGNVQGDTIPNTNYVVPSFGVAVNRQYNHVFKSIKVNMANPIMTDIAARVLENIYSKGGEGERRVVFHGQDIYNVYTSYAYECEVEMIGCAQIWPLMYFQLLNVPMWRGSYMIYKVTHTMVPGNMTTKFVGIKQSSAPICFAQSFFTVKSEKKSIEDYGDYSYSGYGGGEYVYMPDSYPKVETAKHDHYHDNWNHQSGQSTTLLNDPIEEIRDLYNCLYEEIEQLDENGGNSSVTLPQWNVGIVGVLNGGNQPDHTAKKAIDLTIITFKNGDTTKPTFASGKDNKQKLLTVLDMLYLNHKSQVKQCIFEYRLVESMNCSSWYTPDVKGLHLSAKEKDPISGAIVSGDNKTEFWIAAYNTSQKDGAYGRINRNIKGSTDDWFLQNVVPEFRKIASRGWYNDKDNFNTTFINYGHGGFTQDQLVEHFTASYSYSGGTPKEQSERIKIVMDILLKEFNYDNNVAIAIASNMGRESGFNPKATVIDVNGYESGGLCQWQKTRPSIIRSLVSKKGGPSVGRLQDLNIYWQTVGAIEEMKTRKMRVGSCYNGNYNYQGVLSEYDYFKQIRSSNPEALAAMFMGSFERTVEANYNRDMYSTTNGNCMWMRKIATAMGWV